MVTDKIYFLKWAPVWSTAQRATAAFAEGRLVPYDLVWLSDSLQGVTFMPYLPATGFPAWLAQRLRPAKFTRGNAFLRGRDAAVAAVLLRLAR